MQALKYDYGKEPEMVRVINTVDGIQKAIGGFFEVYRLSDDVALLCDGDGRLKQLPFTMSAVLPNYGLTSFCGPVLIVGLRRGNFVNLPEEKVNHIKQCIEYHHPI